MVGRDDGINVRHPSINHNLLRQYCVIGCGTRIYVFILKDVQYNYVAGVF